MMVAPPGVNDVNIPTLDISAPGRIAFAYYGSTNSPYQRCKQECEPKDWAKTTWNGYMAMSVTALDKNPVFYTTTVNDTKDPMKRQRCGPGRCGTSVYDFMDIKISNTGKIWAAFVDACVFVCNTKDGVADDGKEGVVGHLVGGPGLL